jgi:hypothetical protein
MSIRSVWIVIVLFTVSVAWGANLNLPDDEYQRQARALTAQQVAPLAARVATGDARAHSLTARAATVLPALPRLMHRHGSTERNPPYITGDCQGTNAGWDSDIERGGGGPVGDGRA